MKNVTNKQAGVIAINILKFLNRPDVALRAARILNNDRELRRARLKRVKQ